MIEKNDVQYTANLSRLQLDENDMDLFVQNLQNILAYMDKLNELDTSSIEPTAHVLPLKNVKRDDVIMPSLTNNAALQSAPETSDGFFHVPPVI